ncbi:MAG: type IV pilus assembly protein PilP [Oleiphilaceae bacterium]
MKHNIFLVIVVCSSFVLTACSSNDGFSDLDRFMLESDKAPIGRINALPEVQVYRSFTYSAANRRSPFLPPEEVVIKEVQLQQDQSNVKPNLDRVPEVLESFALGILRMVGTLQRNENDVLWALISDNLGSVHMSKVGQYMGKNHGKVVAIEAGYIDIIEIVPNGYGGWLERPRTISLDD